MALDGRYLANNLMVLTLLWAGFVKDEWINRIAGVLAILMLQGVKHSEFLGSLWLFYHYIAGGYYSNFSISGTLQQISTNNIVLGTFCSIYLWSLRNMTKYVANPRLRA